MHLCVGPHKELHSLLKFGGNAGTQGWGVIAVASQKAALLTAVSSFRDSVLSWHTEVV